MELSFKQMADIAEMAATRAIEKLKAAETTKLFHTKAAIARHVGCDRRTVDSMIERGQITITQSGQYKLNY